MVAIEDAKKALEDTAEAVVNQQSNQANKINNRVYSASDMAYRRANATNLPQPKKQNTTLKWLVRVYRVCDYYL